VEVVSRPAIAQAVRAVEADLNGQGRVLLRASGTEPLIRVMVEGRDDVQVRALAQGLAEKVRAEVACA
jgi:phosphoglucosamine mutase